jgi:hypothetical protein
MFRSDEAVRALLLRRQPASFADLPNIAANAGLGSIASAISWLPARVAAEPAAWLRGAAVQVVDRVRWLDAVDKLLPAETELPDGTIAASVRDVPWAGRCIIVPTSIGEVGDSVMLYAQQERSEQITALVPIALHRDGRKSEAINQQCELTSAPPASCRSRGCSGECKGLTAYEDEREVILGCICI